MSRIDFTAPLTVADAEDRHVSDWQTLSQFVGRSFANTAIVGFFGESLDELPVAVLLERSGDLQILSNPQGDGLLARSSVRSARTLTAEELEILQKHVEGQWSDGWGACLDLDGFYFFHIDLDHVDRQQIEDGVVSQGSGTRDLIPAIHAGDLERVRAALDAGENVNAVLGGTTPLGWAFFAGSAPIAHLLIDRGADVHFPQDGVPSFLFSCNFVLSDADAASVAERLLAMGGFEQADIVQAAELAEHRGKKQLVAVLAKAQRA